MTAKIKSGQGLLLYNLWRINGGCVEVAKKCKVHQQAPVNWYIRGSVPLPQLAKVIQGLNLTDVQKWGLNYQEMSYLLPEKPKWREVVQSFPFSSKLKEKILFYAPPTAQARIYPAPGTKR